MAQAQAQVVALYAEGGYACQAVAVAEGPPLGRVEYVGRVPMRVPIGVRPATGAPVPWAELSPEEQADAANAAGPRRWAELTNTQRRGALNAACTAVRDAGRPAADDPGVTGAVGTTVTI